MADLQDIMARMVSQNRQSRERFEGIASRTVSAVIEGNTDELTNIIRDVANSEQGGEVSNQPMEAGSADGLAGNQVAAESSGGN